MFNLSFSSKKAPYKVGVALSGGGARGFAHVGALQAMEDMGLRPDILAGVSAGSIVATLYATGLKPEEILECFSAVSFTDFAWLGVASGGLFKMDGFKKFMLQHLKHSRLEDLPIPTVIGATDLDRCVPVKFETGDIAERVMASCCMPIIFKPIKIDGVSYVDGGVLHNLPAWAIKDKCKYLIGINCSPMSISRGRNHTLIDVAMRAYTMMAKSNAIADMDICDLAVSVDSVARYKVFDLREIKRVYSNGYHAMMEALVANGFKRPEDVARREDSMFRRLRKIWKSK